MSTGGQCQAAAADRLKKTVIEIALEVGFNSKSTFNAAFRHQHGIDTHCLSQLPYHAEPEIPPDRREVVYPIWTDAATGADE